VAAPHVVEEPVVVAAEAPTEDAETTEAKTEA
jgi:hypothetical protein